MTDTTTPALLPLQQALHACNEWADAFYNAKQHIKNLRDGITDFDSVLANLDACEAHCQEEWTKARDAEQAVREALAQQAQWRCPYCTRNGIRPCTHTPDNWQKEIPRRAQPSQSAVELADVPAVAYRCHRTGRLYDEQEANNAFPTDHDKVRAGLAALVYRASLAQQGPMKVEGHTVYELNAYGTNRWWATVQAGRDDNGKRTTDEECRRVALTLAASQPAPAGDVLTDALRELVTLYERNSHATPIDEANGNDSSEREKSAWDAARAALTQEGSTK